ncbi:MAG: helix-turn-helix domain-containing protein [Janthinobacterium lividum]
MANNDKNVIVSPLDRLDFAVQMLPPFPDIPSLEVEVIYRLKQLRRERGYTLQEVYDATGIHIARLEANKANMTVITLAVLCQHYKVTLADFFQGL